MSNDSRAMIGNVLDAATNIAFFSFAARMKQEGMQGALKQICLLKRELQIAMTQLMADANGRTIGKLPDLVELNAELADALALCHEELLRHRYEPRAALCIRRAILALDRNRHLKSL